MAVMMVAPATDCVPFAKTCMNGSVLVRTTSIVKYTKRLTKLPNWRSCHLSHVTQNETESDEHYEAEGSIENCGREHSSWKGVRGILKFLLWYIV
jgi:hypothetical protein